MGNQNKVIPGAYINVVSAGIASAALSDRGIATMPLELDWGPDDTVFKVTTADVQKYSKKIFGYSYTDDKMKGLRDLFAGGTLVLYAYRLNGGGTKASNDYATAKYTGTRGNAIRISIAKDVDDPESWNVTTYLDTSRIEVQNVKKAADLKDNDFVHLKQIRWNLQQLHRQHCLRNEWCRQWRCACGVSGKGRSLRI